MRLYDKPAHVLHDMLVKKEITSVELTKDVISRIDEVEDDVKAYLSQRWVASQGPLAGARFQVMDSESPGDANP